MLYRATVLCKTEEEFEALADYWIKAGYKWNGDPDHFYEDWNYNLLRLWDDDIFTSNVWSSYYSVEGEYDDSDWGGTFGEYMEYAGVNTPSVDIDVSEFL